MLLPNGAPNGDAAAVANGAPPNGAPNGALSGGGAHDGSAGRKQNFEVEVALRQVEEVLEEVASTNKKVFKSIHELLRFLGLDRCKTDGRVDAKGHTWLAVGTEPPSADGARELAHAGLSAALAKKAVTASEKAAENDAAGDDDGGVAAAPAPREVRFTEDEWKEL